MNHTIWRMAAILATLVLVADNCPQKKTTPPPVPLTQGNCAVVPVTDGVKCANENAPCKTAPNLAQNNGTCRTLQIGLPPIASCYCFCVPKAGDGGAASMAGTMWQATAPFDMASLLPGGTMTVSFNLVPAGSSSNLELGGWFGSTSVTVPLVSGAATIVGTRRSAPGEEHLVDLSLVSASVVASSFSFNFMGSSTALTTGPNTITFQTLEGLLDMSRNEVHLLGSGITTNDLLSASSPARFSSKFYGVLQPSTGSLQLSSVSEDTVPGALGIFGAGCVGSGGIPPEISTKGGPPMPGNVNFGLVLDGALGGTNAVLIIGDSNSLALGQFPLPASLAFDPYFLNGCYLFVDPDVFLTATTSGVGPGNGHAEVTLPIPSNTKLSGATIYFQWYVIDPGPTMGPGSMTPALQMTVL